MDWGSVAARVFTGRMQMLPSHIAQRRCEIVASEPLSARECVVWVGCTRSGGVCLLLGCRAWCTRAVDCRARHGCWGAQAAWRIVWRGLGVNTQLPGLLVVQMWLWCWDGGTRGAPTRGAPPVGCVNRPARLQSPGFMWCVMGTRAPQGAAPFGGDGSRGKRGAAKCLPPRGAAAALLAPQRLATTVSRVASNRWLGSPSMLTAVIRQRSSSAASPRGQ